MQDRGATEPEETATAGVDAEADESREGVYEIGYHLLPTLSESGVAEKASALADLLKENGATSVGERSPSRMQLAYGIEKRVDGKPARFDEAYFGWTAFAVSREAVAAIKNALDADPLILRYLIIATTRDAVAASLSGATAAAMSTPHVVIERPKREAEKSAEVSDVALEEALKTIATEDAKVEE